MPEKKVISFKKTPIYFVLILLHGCFLVEDFNDFRLCSSAAGISSKHETSSC